MQEPSLPCAVNDDAWELLVCTQCGKSVKLLKSEIEEYDRDNAGEDTNWELTCPYCGEELEGMPDSHTAFVVLKEDSPDVPVLPK